MISDNSEAHDFFDPQPITNADVFFVKCVLHDWSDPYCVKILRQLRDAAKPETRLFVMDKIVPYTCPPSAQDAVQVPGILAPQIPPSPLTNVSIGTVPTYMITLLVSLILKKVFRITYFNFGRCYLKCMDKSVR